MLTDLVIKAAKPRAKPEQLSKQPPDLANFLVFCVWVGEGWIVDEVFVGEAIEEGDDVVDFAVGKREANDELIA